MELISAKEQHNILLEIAKVFDKICTQHNIPYYMLGGTMLGAIRHKGFIPWDDDMDFGVPRTFYKTLINILEDELPENYRCCSYKNNPNIFSPFIKIEDIRTVIIDPRIPLSVNEQMGINIDIFPLDFCDNDSKIANKASKMTDFYSFVYVDADDGNRIKNLVKRLVRAIVPWSRTEYLDRLNACLESSDNKGKLLANVFGRWRKKEWVPVEWYGENVRYPFEDYSFCGLENYDGYLSALYGDYMQLPPKDKQLTHVTNIFIR